MRLLSAVSLLLILAAASNAQTPATPASAGPTTAAPAFTGVTTSLLLDGSLSSRGVHEGQKITAYFRKETTLPTGEVFPIHTALRGHVVKVSKSSKGKPNGILELIFDTALPKKGDPVPVTVKIKDVNSPGADETGGPSVEKKSKKGVEKKDTDAQPKVPNQTGIPGVFLQIPADGSAILYTPGDDVEVSDGIQMTALIARATPQAP